MSLPWSAQQVECLQAMGFDALHLVAATPAAAAANADDDLPPGLRRAARGVDLAALLQAQGAPRDVGSRRRFWRALRPLRKAART
jgi:hypothetical protein